MVEDPRAWFHGVPRVMFVHAHPDDETITTGGTLAALAEAGQEPLLVTLTRGEQGEVTPGPFAQLQGTEGLAPHRQTELAAALAMLGITRHVFLGVPPARADGLPPTIYEDSGMEWDAAGRATFSPDAGTDALTQVPAVEALNDLIAAAHNAGAGAIVSYDDDGGYGHPDHVLTHRLARAVAQGLGIPFWIITPTEAMADPEPDSVEMQDLERHDVSPWLDRKVAALRVYGTQLTVDGDDIVHVGGQRQPIDRVESFRLLQPIMPE
jgi:N-acetyl-1-D-myo-inositol-2-amino-2-deoxy-alpha-D-glucopyranoside deacetylase